MLGVDERPRRSTHELRLQPGDTIVLFTDGLVERRSTPLETSLEQLRAAVESHAGRPDPLAEHLLTAFAEAPSDDVALLVLRVEG
jgi:serine phosphatase RsbU (regulator of sigma subunit)